MTSKLTRYIIQSKIADFFAGVVEIHTKLGGPNTAEEAQNQLTERVLACVPVVDSEPYGFTDGDRRGMIYEPQYADRLNKPIPVYRHAQQPVVPPMQHWEELCREYPDMSIGDAIIRAAWWNHCRAAMLQAGYSPPHSGIRPEQSGTSPAHAPSREHFISLCNEFWNWSEMDLVCSDDRGYELRMEWDGKVFKHPVTQALWRMYQAAPGNSPVIPGRWIPVSERMPETDGNYWGWWSESKRQGPVWFIKSELQAQFQSHEITHWMPLPAAPQEVKGEHQIRDEMDMGARITSHRFKV